MSSFDLKECCHINTNVENDFFVGIKIEDNCPKIYFPIGFNLSKDLKNLKKDIRLLINVLSIFNKNIGENILIDKVSEKYNCNFPIKAFFDVIDYYLNNNCHYYREYDKKEKIDTKGKILWKKTIKSQKAFIKNNQPIYSQFVVENQSVFNNRLITKIHEYCFYVAFQNVGWFYSSFEIPKPEFFIDENNKNYVLNELNKKIKNTNLEKDKTLFLSMKCIIESSEYRILKKSLYYGVEDFALIWQGMIDKMFGIKNKSEYFPRGIWVERINYNNKYKYPLEPDSIMILNDGDINEKFYILDSKYYKYGVTHDASHLPNSSDINKQITYAEFLKNKKILNNDNLFNAFVIPFDSNDNTFETNEHIINVAYCYGEWRKKENINLQNYEKIQAILIDTKYVMTNFSKDSIEDKKKLALVIEACKKDDV